MKVRLGVSLLSVASPSLCGGVAALLCILWFPERSCGWCWRALRVFVLLVVAYVLACPGRVGRPFSCGPPPFFYARWSAGRSWAAGAARVFSCGRVCWLPFGDGCERGLRMWLELSCAGWKPFVLGGFPVFCGVCWLRCRMLLC